MEIEEESNRPSVGFPLGLALLLILLVFMCGFFTCCIHWNKLRSLLGLPTDQGDEFQQDSPHKPPPLPQEAKKRQAESLPVVMPGDQMPKFIAIACPCEPPIPIPPNFTVHVHNLPSFSFPFYPT